MHESSRPEAELMAELAGGQMPALAALVRRHQDRVRALAFRISGRWDVADDITQETFLRVYRSANSYKPSAAFTTWLYRIVVNLCLDQAKRPRAASLANVEPLADDAADPLVRRERLDAIRREVDALPQRQRIALILHRFDGLDHSQIAQAMDCTESAVESLLVRAYAQLRQRLRNWIE
jgi:RNA polymerase sigma-70 factor (ECF subfamily)